MAVFGWICWLLLTLYVTVCAAGIAALCHTVSGRISEGWIGLIVAGLMWWGVVSWAPFAVVAN